MLRYAMIQAASGGVERRKRSQGDGGGYDGSEKTGGETDEAIAVYTYGQFARARNINSTRQGAPNLPGARTHFATPGQARETTICYGSALLRQCAPGFGRCFDGETHPSSSGRSEKHLEQTSSTCPLSRSRRISDRQRLGAVPVHASRWHGCLWRLMQAPKLPLKLECCSERRPSANVTHFWDSSLAVAPPAPPLPVTRPLVSHLLCLLYVECVQ